LTPCDNPLALNDRLLVGIVMPFTFQERTSAVPFPFEINALKFAVNPVHIQRPDHLSADNLPEELKVRVIPYLESCLELDLDDEQKTTVTGLIAQIQSAPFDSELWAKSQSYNSVLNEIRHEDHLSLFKEQVC
jgi:hypothetical protein